MTDVAFGMFAGGDILVFFSVMGAALLWMGGALAATGRACIWPLSGGLTLAAVIVTGCALWLPVQLATGPADGLWMPWRLVASVVLSLTIASLLALAGWWFGRRRVLAALAVVPVLLVECMLYITLGLPALAWPEAMAHGAVLAGSLLMLYLPQLGRIKRHLWVRAACAFLATCLLSLTLFWSGDWQETSAWAARVRVSAIPTWIFGLALLAAASLAMMSGVLLFVIRRVPLREAGLAYDSHRRPTVTDALTQLPTRSFFEKRLEVEAAKCDKYQRRMALLFIDLDGFKPVNDTYGHGHGDSVLQQVGKRLRVLARSGHVAARVGGDEFLLMMRHVQSPDEVAVLAGRLIKHLSQPYQVDHQEVSISCSVGIVLYPDAAGRSKLIARADAAMYAAKRSGGACYCFYTPAMDADSEEKFELVRGLREAVECEQFELYYQPKVDTQSGKITSAEALLRWQHPTRGLVLPGIFIPVAERCGLMGFIGHWVIEDACRQIRQWREQGLRMRVAINLSAMQLRQEDIAQRIGEALQRYQIDPALLTCEITESAAMEDTRTTQETLRQLGALGVHISIDDFGTGYSSLSYLRQLPAEELKIDRSFIVDIESSTDARSVVDAVVKLAHALGLTVVAEGVENLHQQEILTELGCDQLQGYLFAKPMTAHALLLAAQQPRPEMVSFRSSLFDTLGAREVV